jgi:hypothetical protein
MSEQRNPWPHIGQLFVEQGRLTSEQVEDALAEQRSTGNPLGEILVARGHISRIDLAAALSTQWTWQKTGRPLEETPAEAPTAVEAPPVELVEPEPVTHYEPVEETAPAIAVGPPVAVTSRPEPAPPFQPRPPVMAPVAPPTPPASAQPPLDLTGGLESRVAALEADGRLVADLQARLRSGYEQLAAAEARLSALEPGVAALAQAYNTLVAQLQAQNRELEALRAASVKHEAQISTAARALLA